MTRNIVVSHAQGGGTFTFKPELSGPDKTARPDPAGLAEGMVYLARDVAEACVVSGGIWSEWFRLRGEAGPQGPAGPPGVGGPESVDLWRRKIAASRVTLNSPDYEPMHDLIAPASWVDEAADGTTVTVTPKAVNGLPGGELADCSKFEFVPLAKLRFPRALVQGDQIVFTLLAELTTGADTQLRMRLTTDDYGGFDEAATWQGLRIDAVAGTWSGDFGGDLNFVTQPPTISSTSVSGSLQRVTLTMTVDAAVPADTDHLWIGFGPETSNEVWDFAVEDVTVSPAMTTSLVWTDQQGLSNGVAAVALDSAGGPTAPPLAASVVALVPAVMWAPWTLLDLTDGAGWSAVVRVTASGDLQLSLTEPTQGTLTATAQTADVPTDEAVAYTLHVLADGTVELWIDDAPATTNGTTKVQLAGTAGDLPASGLTLHVGRAANGSEPWGDELVRSQVRDSPQWRLPLEAWVDAVGVAPVRGWLYGTSG